MRPAILACAATLALSALAGCTTPAPATPQTAPTEALPATSERGEDRKDAPYTAAVYALYINLSELATASADVVERVLYDDLTLYKAEREIEQYEAALTQNRTAFSQNSPPAGWETTHGHFGNATWRFALGLLELKDCVKENDVRSCDTAAENFWSRDCNLRKGLMAAPLANESIRPPTGDDPVGDCRPWQEYKLTVMVEGNSWTTFSGAIVSIDARGERSVKNVSGQADKTFDVVGRAACVELTKTDAKEGVLMVTLKKGTETLGAAFKQHPGETVRASGSYPDVLPPTC